MREDDRDFIHFVGSPVPAPYDSRKQRGIVYIAYRWRWQGVPVVFQMGVN